MHLSGSFFTEMASEIECVKMLLIPNKLIISNILHDIIKGILTNI